MFDLIRGSSKHISEPNLILKLVMDYGNDFGIDANLVVRRTLQLLSSGIARCAILRRRIINIVSNSYSER